MRLARKAWRRGEGGLAMLIVLLLIALGIFWWLYSSRRSAEKNMSVFAAELSKRVAVDYDRKYFNIHLSRTAQEQLIPSWRDRFFEQLRTLGKPSEPIELEGKTEFSSLFFDPHGTFKAHLKYPETTAELEFIVSRGMALWQIETVGLIWTPPPMPTPTPSPTPTATATPAPSQKTRRKAR